MPTKPTNDSNALAEQILNQVVDSINLVTQATTRLDERIKILAEKQSELESKNEKVVDNYHNVANRVTAFETKDLPNTIISLQNHFRDLEKIASEELDTLALEFNFADDSIENKIYEYVMSDYCSPSELTPLIRNYKIKLLIDDKLE